MSAPGARWARLDELDRVPLEGAWWRPVRRRLGVTAFGVNAYTADATGDPLIEEHDERSPGAGGQQELYVVVAGRARFELDGEAVDAPAGTLIAVEPGTLRSATAAEAQTTVLVLGGPPGAALPPSPFEYWYSAIPAHEAGDHAAACETIAEGLEHYPDHGAIHYALACELSLIGRAEAAIEHLTAAFADDPRTREWALDDRDLDPIRERPDYPG